MNDKVVQFPEKNTDAGFPTSVQESLEHVARVRKEYCDEVASDVFDAALTVINNYGVTIRTNQLFIKDAVFLEETIKALVYRMKRIEHPFHDMIENTISISDELRAEIEERLEETSKIK